jgi:histidinol dehydrogenase
MKLVKTFGDGAMAAETLIEQIERRGAVNTAKVDTTVRTILSEVRQGGMQALVEYAGRFDGLRIAKDGSGGVDQPLRVSREEMKAAWDETDDVLKAAMQAARTNIRTFAERQMPKSWTSQPVEGVETGQVVRPLSSVGCYVPGGRYPLPSTLLMTVTPAQVAGVERIVVCSPKPARETMAAGWLAGVTEFYRVGGVQAVAAMAYGAASSSDEHGDAILPVDKIVGPGNLYVTAAKLAVSGTCGIDMPAGPTEIVVTSETGDAAGIAADLVAQAEHDPEALAVLITSNEELAKAVAAEVKRQAAGNAIAEEAIAAQGVAFVTRTVRAAQELTNRLAPEHLSVDEGSDVRWVQNAGSVFVGRYTPQSMGDYVSGPNHVLPTGRSGRVRGGLSVLDFVKVITVQRYTKAGLEMMGPHAIALAEAEGLVGHAASVRVKLAMEAE